MMRQYLSSATGLTVALEWATARVREWSEKAKRLDAGRRSRLEQKGWLRPSRVKQV